MTQQAKIEGRAVEFTMLWSPQQAAEVAKLLMQAANKCLQGRSPIILPRGYNG
jgi:hypothetical protein